jgi:hypothetical protein
VNLRLWLFQEVHTAPILEWLPMFLRKFPPKQLKLLQVRAIGVIVLPVDLQSLQTFVYDTRRIFKAFNFFFFFFLKYIINDLIVDRLLVDETGAWLSNSFGR